jgi:hypothetical protein
MRFQPKNIEELRSQNLLQPGVYHYRVLDAIEGIAKSSGNPQIILELRISDDERLVSLTDYLTLTDKAMFKIHDFCLSAGLMDKYNDGNLTAQDCIDATGLLEIKIEVDPTGQYPNKNKVKAYLEPTVKLGLDAIAKVSDFKDDTDIPF